MQNFISCIEHNFYKIYHWMNFRTYRNNFLLRNVLNNTCMNPMFRDMKSSWVLIIFNWSTNIDLFNYMNIYYNNDGLAKMMIGIQCEWLIWLSMRKINFRKDSVTLAWNIRPHIMKIFSSIWWICQFCVQFFAAKNFSSVARDMQRMMMTCFKSL